MADAICPKEVRGYQGRRAAIVPFDGYARPILFSDGSLIGLIVLPAYTVSDVGVVWIGRRSFTNSADDRMLSIPWQKPPAKKSRQILLPHGASHSKVRPEQFERRARRSALSREVVDGWMMLSRVSGDRWSDDIRLSDLEPLFVWSGVRPKGRR
jgi:hypothetical protein